MNIKDIASMKPSSFTIDHDLISNKEVGEWAADVLPEHVEVHEGVDFRVYKYSEALLEFIREGHADAMIALHKELVGKEDEDKD